MGLFLIAVVIGFMVFRARPNVSWGRTFGRIVFLFVFVFVAYYLILAGTVMEIALNNPSVTQ